MKIDFKSLIFSLLSCACVNSVTTVLILLGHIVIVLIF